MATIEQQSTEDSLEEKTVREEIKNPYFWYLFVLFAIYLASLLIPAILFMTYMFLFFLPHFLETTSFIALFTEFKPFLALISMPFVLICCYLLRLFFIGLITRGFWSLSEKRSPSKEGIIPRNFPSKTLNYYQMRGFMLKYGKNAFMKGLFPWLSNWFFNFIGASKIGKGTTLEESVCNDKFISIGENCYIGVNSTLTSHLIEGIFGNISYFEIKVGNNVTASAMANIAPGCEVFEDSYLLPLASTPKHSVLKGGKNFYFGIPMRRIFRRKIMEYLDVKPEDLEKNQNINGYKDKNLLKKLKTMKDIKQSEIFPKNEQEFTDSNEDNIDINNINEEDLRIDFTTSSAISRVNLKFLIVYIPIFWLSGMLVTIMFYTFTYYVGHNRWLVMAFFLPTMVILMWFIFIIASFFFTKLFLILINLIHKPKEGIFKSEVGDPNFEFWCLRTELRKIVLWLIRNWPLPWMDILAFKWFGIKMTLSSSLFDSWCDGEFIKMGRRVLIGQGATIMSSMVVGKYLIIKDVILDDYVVIGGHSTISPGTIVGKDSVVGAISTTTYNQILEPGWIYFGIPVIKLKKNRYAEERRDIVMKKDVDEERKFEVEHEINIEEDKKDLT